MRKILTLSGFALLLFSCKDDDSRTCTNCTSPITASFELCRESDGNASVNGENTGISYEVYLNGLMEEGTDCAQ